MTAANRLPGIPIYVSELVPEMSHPPPSKALRNCPSRRGGKRTDFGRHFRADTFTRGLGGPAPRPEPGLYMINGECHMHPKTFERLKQALPVGATPQWERE